MQKAAVSLAYDGGTATQIHDVLPVLRQFGVCATFYVEPARLLENLKAWKTAERDGHEVGNGTLMEAALPDGSLPALHLASLLEDAAECDQLLSEEVSNRPRSIGLPLGKDLCADGPYTQAFIERYPVVRTGQFGVNSLLKPVERGLLTIPCRGSRVQQVIDAVREAMRMPAWLILSVGDVGEGGFSAEDHATLVKYLGSSLDVLDVAPVVHIARRERLVQPTPVHVS